MNLNLHTNGDTPSEYIWNAPAAPIPVTEALQSTDAATRTGAEYAAAALVGVLREAARKKQSVDETMQQLQEEIRAMRRRRNWQMTRTVIVAIVVITVFRWHVFDYGFMLLFLGGAAQTASNSRYNAAHKLGEAGDPRAVGVLAVALRDGDGEIRTYAANALRRLLPRVRANHAAFFSEEQRNALLALAYQGDWQLKMALLDALEQIGTGHSLAAVEYMLQDPTQRVRERAAECLPAIRQRARHDEESATLLRASDAYSAIPSGQLLRPATALSATPPEQLLRPLDQKPPSDSLLTQEGKPEGSSSS